MPLTRAYLKNFRLFSELDLSFDKNTIILGNNGTGKTSLIEAINLLLTRRSLRTKDLKECIKYNKKGFLLGLECRGPEESLKIKSEKLLDKRVTFKISSKNKLYNKTSLPISQVILPNDFRMIEGQPDLRRMFFSKNMFHVEPLAKKVNDEYRKILIQRNFSIKRKSTDQELSVWTDKLLQQGALLNKVQLEFFNKIDNLLSDLYKKHQNKKGLSFLEGIKVDYYQGWTRGESLKRSLEQSLKKDRALGYTTEGPHRFDLKFSVNNKPVKSTLSRGQQKLLILLVIFRLNDLLSSANPCGVVYLIDDLSSELDSVNLNIALKEIAELNSQVIVSSIEEKGELKNKDFLSQFKQINL